MKTSKLVPFLLGACLAAPVVSASPLLRIMPLGDSITEGAGAGSTGGYRGPLWTKLVTEDLYNVDYVGSNTTNPDTTNGMDRDHEGHGGWRIDGTSGGNGIFEMLPTWFSSIESPDVILLHLGTNDAGSDALNNMARTTALLDRLFAMQPSAHVFVSTLMWRNDATRYARIQTYNSNLTNVVAAQVAKGQKISIVDMHAAVPGGDEFGTVNFGDGFHPNTTGYALMAEAWRNAVEELYPDPENFTTTNAPAVVTATVDKTTYTTITLRLNTAVTQASAANLANYALSGGTFASAALNTSGDSRTITLTLSSLADYGAQTLTVSGLVNAAGTASSSAQTFNFTFPYPVPYLDPATHTTNNCTAYTLYTGQTKLDGGWYVVSGAVTNNARIVVSGDVNLILADGAELVAKKGVNVAVANSLTVWAQSDGEGMGSLTAIQVDVSQCQSAIGGDTGQQGGTVVINGGRVSATGWGAGIGGGDGGSGATDDGVGVSGFTEFQLNGDPTLISDGEMQLSPAQNRKGGTAFWRKRVNVVRPWRVFFTYKTVNVPDSPADGFAFFLHNDARGLSARGDVGSTLCANGISPSVGTAYNIYHADSAGWLRDGATTNMSTALGGISIRDGMDVCVTYDGEGRIVQHLFSNGSYVAFTNDVDLAVALGDTTAWLGFSGATGAYVCEQRITNFRFWQADAKGSAPDISASNDASKWRLNGSAVYESFSNAPAFRITDMSNNTSGLVTRLERVYVGGPFKVRGTYHVTGNSSNDSNMADGIALFFHTQSPAAIGGKGSDRGVLGNSALPSATGWMINIYPRTPNITPLKNCVQGSSFTALNGINPKTKVPVDFTLSYVPGRLSFTLEQDGKTATTSQNVDLAQTFGDKFAYFSISGGTGTHNARQYVYNLSMECVNEGGGTVVINGGTVTATGNNYGIEAGDGSVTINGGTVTATGADGIYARCGITFGWTNPADSITASSFSSGDGVSIKAGQTFADEHQNLYEGTLDTAALVAVRNKTLRPYIPLPSFTDPEGRDIEDPGVINWLSENGFTQADIDDLGHDADATDRLYECWLLNLNFKVQDAGATLCFTDITVSNRVSMTVQFVRKAPLAGRINGTLLIYGANNLAAGFSRSPIPDESVEYFTGDPTFNLVTASNDTVTQTAVATLNSSVTAKFFKATIEVPIPYDPEEP